MENTIIENFDIKAAYYVDLYSTSINLLYDKNKRHAFNIYKCTLFSDDTTKKEYVKINDKKVFLKDLIKISRQKLNKKK